MGSSPRTVSLKDRWMELRTDDENLMWRLWCVPSGGVLRSCRIHSASAATQTSARDEYQPFWFLCCRSSRSVPKHCIRLPVLCGRLLLVLLGVGWLQLCGAMLHLNSLQFMTMRTVRVQYSSGHWCPRIQCIHKFHRERKREKYYPTTLM